MLYREPMWLKFSLAKGILEVPEVSVLYREPMWLKYHNHIKSRVTPGSFSALP